MAGPPPGAPSLVRPDVNLIPTTSSTLQAQQAALATQAKYLGDQFKPQRKIAATESSRSLQDQGLFDRTQITETPGGGYNIQGLGEGQASRNLAFRQRGAQATAGVTGSERDRGLQAGMGALKNQAQAQLRGNQNTQAQSIRDQAQAQRGLDAQIAQNMGEQTDFKAQALMNQNQLKAQNANAQMQADYQAETAKHQYDLGQEANAIAQAQFDASQAQSHSQWYINFISSQGNDAHARALAGLPG